MGEIIAAVIGGVFALLVAVVHTKKTCDCNTDPYRNFLIPNQVLPDIYEPPNNADLSRSKYIKVNNGKYKIKVPSGLKMVPSNTTGLVNIFKIFTSNYDKCEFELMHCFSTYPMDVKDANLQTINSLKEKYDPGPSEIIVPSMSLIFT